MTLRGSDLKLDIEAVRGTYEGKIGAAGDSIWYAYYDKSRGNFLIDLVYLQRSLEQLPGANPATQRRMVEELLGTSLPVFEKDLKNLLKNLPGEAAGQQPAPFTPPASKAIIAGVRKYTEIPVPILAIFAMPNGGQDETEAGAQAKAFEAAIPSSRVVRLPGANHFVFRSNEADVLREINAFVKRLPH